MSEFNLTQTESCHYTMDVTVPAAEVSTTFKNARNAIRGQVNMPGFRKGKAPDTLLNRKYGPHIKDEAGRKLLEKYVAQGIKDNDLEPLTMPSFVEGKEGEVEEGKAFEFTVEFDVRPEIELPEYKGLKLTKKAVEISDEQVDEFISQRLEGRATYGAVDREAQSGDMLKAALSCDLDQDAEEVPDAAKRMVEAEESWILLSEPEMIPGTAEGLQGVKAGDEKELDVTYPDDFYEPFLAGKSLKYTFKIDEVQGKTIPELTDEIAKELGGESVDDLKEKVKEHLKAEQDNAGRMELQEQITTQLVEKASFDIPPQTLKLETDAAVRQMNAQNTDETSDESDTEQREKAEKEAADRLKMRFLIEEISKKEEIKVEPNELSSELQMFKMYSGLSDKDFAERFDQQALIERFYMNAMHTKVMDLLIEQADVEETK